MSSAAPALWTCTNAEYHADTERVSRSMAETYRKSPRLYHGRYVSRTIPPPEPTPALRLGSAFHSLTLEPSTYDGLYFVAPKCDRRTKAGKAEWAAAMAEAGTRTLVKQDEAEQVQAWRDAVMANPHARTLIECDGLTEQSLQWRDPQTGLALKARTDKLINVLIVDLKSAAEVAPARWIRSCVSFGYHRQAAWYIDGVQALTGEQAGMVFLVVGKEPPHEVATYELDGDALLLGRGENSRTLRELADRYERDEWTADYELEPLTLSLPRWAGNDAAWEVSE